MRSLIFTICWAISIILVVYPDIKIIFTEKTPNSDLNKKYNTNYSNIADDIDSISNNLDLAYEYRYKGKALTQVEKLNKNLEKISGVIERLDNYADNSEDANIKVTISEIFESMHSTIRPMLKYSYEMVENDVETLKLLVKLSKEILDFAIQRFELLTLASSADILTQIENLQQFNRISKQELESLKELNSEDSNKNDTIIQLEKKYCSSDK